MNQKLLLLALALSLGSIASPKAHAAPGARAVRAAPQAANAQARKAAPRKTERTTTALKTAKKELSPAQTITRTKKLASAYVTEHGLETRVLKVGPEGRQIERVFVPILPTTYDAFHRTFAASSGNDSIVLRHTASNAHLVLAVEPGDLYLWAQNKNVGGNGNSFYQTTYMSKDGASQTWAGHSIVVHPSSVPSLKGYLAEKADGPRVCPGNCMEWLPNATTGPQKTLFHDLGITRSRDGNNMRAKILHAGNHRVGLVGVHVTSLEQFRNMTNEQLTGPVPTAGIEAAVAP